MTWVSDDAVLRLRRSFDWPDLSGTKYSIVDHLGRGGMGSVYLARDRDLDREVALKVLDAPTPTAEACARMLREARVLARLEHPGIVPVHDVGTLPDGRAYYVMKRVRGARLDQHGGLGTIAERVRLLGRICESVAFAHAHGVIHRDLKPQNVMIGEFGEVLVMDWGVAKLLGGEGASDAPRADADGPRSAPAEAETSALPGTTAHGTILGTPAYMAPEQAAGDVGRVGERADVYGLGAILYYLLSGRPPQPETEADAAPPAGVSGAAPRALKAIREKAMARDPRARYESVLALASDLDRFLAGEPVSALAEGWLGRSIRLASKYRTPILLVLAYLVMRIVIFFVSRR